MTRRHEVVTLFDVDNTLLDNDGVERDLRAHMKRALGAERQAAYWSFFEELRGELGYADYLGALQRYREANPRDPHVLGMSQYLIDYPFAERLFPGSVDAVERMRKFGPVVVLSDGDAVFQPLKVERSGLAKVFKGHVLIYIHKEQMLDDVEDRYPSDRYVMVDDKLRILFAMKEVWGPRLVTVFPRQGHWALDEEANRGFGPPDVTLERIGDLVSASLDDLLEAAS